MGYVSSPGGWKLDKQARWADKLAGGSNSPSTRAMDKQPLTSCKRQLMKIFSDGIWSFNALIEIDQEYKCMWRLTARNSHHFSSPFSGSSHITVRLKACSSMLIGKLWEANLKIQETNLLSNLAYFSLSNECCLRNYLQKKPAFCRRTTSINCQIICVMQLLILKISG